MKSLAIYRFLIISIHFFIENNFFCYSKNIIYNKLSDDNKLNLIFKTKIFDIKNDDSISNHKNVKKFNINQNSSKQVYKNINKPFFNLIQSQVYNSDDKKSCKIFKEEPSLNVYLSPTVVKARALEKFRYNYKNYDSYSIWFQIKKIYKYENKKYNEYAKGDYEFNNYLNISSDENDLNNFLFIENFYSNKTNNKNGDYCNKIDIKLGRDYYLFLNSQNNKLSLDDRRFFTHKVRLGSLKSNVKNKYIRNVDMNPVKKFNSNSNNRPYNIYNLRKINAFDSSYFQDEKKHENIFKKDTISNHRNQKLHKISNIVATLKIPIFEIISKPILESVDKDIESEINNVLCEFCEKAPVIKMNKKSVFSSVNHKVNLECRFDGNPKPIIFWRKNRNEYIFENNEKYNIYSDENISILTINNLITLDSGDYYCLSYDFVSGLGRLVFNKTRLTVVYPSPRKKYTPTSLSLKKSSFNKNVNNQSIINQIPETKSSTIKIPLNTTKYNSLNATQLKNILLNTSRQNQNLNNMTNTKLASLITNSITKVYSKFFNTTSLDINFDLLSKTTTTITTVDNQLQFIRCKKQENTCLNDGICYISNPNYSIYKNEIDYFKIKFCICKDFYEGSNCEFKVMKTIYYDQEEIPDDMKDLWIESGKRRKQPDYETNI